MTEFNTLFSPFYQNFRVHGIHKFKGQSTEKSPWLTWDCCFDEQASFCKRCGNWFKITHFLPPAWPSVTKSSGEVSSGATGINLLLTCHLFSGIQEGSWLEWGPYLPNSSPLVFSLTSHAQEERPRLPSRQPEHFNHELKKQLIIFEVQNPMQIIHCFSDRTKGFSSAFIFLNITVAGVQSRMKPIYFLKLPKSNKTLTPTCSLNWTHSFIYYESLAPTVTHLFNFYLYHFF